jgi:hypothetical protein
LTKWCWQHGRDKTQRCNWYRCATAQQCFPQFEQQLSRQICFRLQKYFTMWINGIGVDVLWKNQRSKPHETIPFNVLWGAHNYSTVEHTLYNGSQYYASSHKRHTTNTTKYE